MQAVLRLALHGHAGADDLGQAVDVVGADARLLLDALAHGLAPRLGAKHARLERKLAEVHPLGLRLLRQVQEVAGGAGDGGDAEVAQHHDLAVGVAAGDGDHRHAQRLGPVMRPQPAGEQPVPVGVLQDVAAPQPAGRKAARHHRAPHVNVLLRVAHDGRLAGGAAGHVQPHHLAERHREQAEGVVGTQVVLDHKGQVPQVVQRTHVVGLQPTFVHAPMEQRHTVVGQPDRRLQALQLQLAQPFDREVVRGAGRVKRARGVVPLLADGHGWVVLS
ncbi:MAG: hypothetical protein BWZ02_03127 [Lentisphaerae bacterium ADurb.BinA184]|nr:MAG: hypothetical protein BWZ02_03127 [Lentisphaerae bacterium ADurb.BinA184]